MHVAVDNRPVEGARVLVMDPAALSVFGIADLNNRGVTEGTNVQQQLHIVHNRFQVVDGIIAGVV